MELTDRQAREVAYHREHAKLHADMLGRPMDWAVLETPQRRWFNPYWRMWALLKEVDLRGKRVLVVGCGFGDDALRLAKLGAEVFAFDLSPDSLQLARQLAERERLQIDFRELPAESLDYPDKFFHVVVCRDILHHVDIPATVHELRRVSNPGAVWVVNEIYSHLWTERLRRSRFVEGWLYPKVQRVIYGPGRPYITADERKMNQRDMALVVDGLNVRHQLHFNFLVTRILPEMDFLARVDRALLAALRPLGALLAGRVIVVGVARTQYTSAGDKLNESRLEEGLR